LDFSKTCLLQPKMKLLLSITLFSLMITPNFSWAKISVTKEQRTIVVSDLANFNYTEKIELLKLGENQDYFQFGIREGDELEGIEVFIINNGKKKKYNINNSLSTSTIDNSSFFSGRKIYYFSLSTEGRYEINYSVKSKESIFIAELHKNGQYDALISTYQIELPDNLQMSTSQMGVLKGSVQLKQSDFLDSTESLKVLVHPVGTEPIDYFSNWFEGRLQDISSLSQADIPEELIALQNGPKEQLAKAIFDYVKRKITYVDIENGINAIVPRDCKFVQKKGRGDCKDMANLLFSLYKYFEFDAYLAISKTSSIKEKFDFPSLAEANHMICVLYLDSKPIFLDATENECEFRDPSLQIFNTEAFLIGKKPFFIDVSGVPFFESKADIDLIFTVNDQNEWNAQMSFSALGKSNTILKGLMGDKKYQNNLPKIAQVLVNLNWELVSNSHTDTSSYLEFSAPIPKSNIMNVGKSSYIDLAKRFDLNMITFLFYGDTLPAFTGQTNLNIEFPGEIKSHIPTMENDFYKISKNGNKAEMILIELKRTVNKLSPSEWSEISEKFKALFNKPIEISYEKN